MKVFECIKSGTFGDENAFKALISAVVEHGDFYLVSDDFNSYCKTQDLIDETFKNQEEWVSKCITSVARMGFFTSDRCINEYADTIWNIEPLAVKDEQEVRQRTGLDS
jgi:starch phosphorylase